MYRVGYDQWDISRIQSSIGHPDPYLWLLDPDLAPDPTLFLSDYQDARKWFFCSYFLLITNPQGTLYSVLKICFAKILCWNFILLALFQWAGSGYIPLTSGSGSGRPKTCRSGSKTLIRSGTSLHLWDTASVRHLSRVSLVGTGTVQIILQEWKRA